MEKFDKTNPYNPDTKKAIKINLGKPKLPKWAKIILISFLSINALILIAIFIKVLNETPSEKKARESLHKELEIQEQMQVQKEAEEEVKKYTKEDALAHSQVYIRSKLKSPATADFDSSSEGVKQINDTTFTVSSFVDSQNGFGALLRSQYFCKIVFHSKNDTHDITNAVIK
jgi:hypothetical protein